MMIYTSQFAASLNPLRQIFQLYIENGRLKVVQSAVKSVAYQITGFSVLPMISEEIYLLSYFRIVCCDNPAISRAARDRENNLRTFY